MKKIRPFLKWAGSKYNCLDKVFSALEPGQRLIEPFAGSGVVFMNADYQSYILGESNPDLVFLFTTLQQEGKAFIDYCEQYFIPDTNLKDFYYQTRHQFNALSDSLHKSALFLYLNRHGYNGLCRYNSSGQFNVPFGLYTKPYFPRKEMEMFHLKSKKATFVHGDFRQTFQLAKRGDVIYCDPPYVPITANTKVLPYTAKKFAETDQIELAELARKTAKKGITVLISNHDTDFTRHHYQTAEIKSFPVSRSISCQSELRQPVNELIAIFKG